MKKMALKIRGPKFKEKNLCKLAGVQLEELAHLVQAARISGIDEVVPLQRNFEFANRLRKIGVELGEKSGVQKIP